MQSSIASEAGSESPGRSVRVWDLPTRLFHWLLAIAFAAQWWTQDDARLLDYHVFAGYAIGLLLLFRIIWGFAGTRYARFKSFAFGLGEGLRHLRHLLTGRHERHLGHNPAGTWSIFGLLALGLATVLTGIATLGGAKQLGPMQALIGYARGDALAIVHKYLAWSMLVLVALHVIGVLVTSRAEHENLAWSMVVGTKHPVASLAGVPAATSIGLLLILVVAAGSWLYFRGYVFATADRPYLPFTRTPLAQNDAWNKECSGCHLDYHPSILPARSWNKLLDDQHAHFGEDLDLDQDTIGALRQYALKNAAESHATTLAWKVDSTAAQATPLRVTETEYWKHRHAELSDADWNRNKRFACDGCHVDAAAGTFLPGAMQVCLSVAEKAK
jgi:cytochrome b